MSAIHYSPGRPRRAALSLAPCLMFAAGCPADPSASTEGATTSGLTTTSGTTTPDPTTGTTTSTTTEAQTTTEAPTTGPPTSSTSTGPAPAVCGDGVVADTEVCDDGNDVPDDGCNSACELTAAIAWTYTYNGPGSKDDRAAAVAVDATGRVIVAGFETDAMNKLDMLLIALGPDGEELWREARDGAAGLHDAFTSVVLDDAGNIYAGGYEETASDVTDAVVRAFDPDGGELWAFNEPPPVADFSRVNGLTVEDGALYSTGARDLLDAGTELVVRRHDLATGEAAWTTVTQADALRALGEGIARSGADIVVAGYVVNDAYVSSPLLVVVNDAGDIVSADIEDHPVGAWYGVTAIGDAGDLLLAGRRRPPGATEIDIALRRVGPDLAEKWTITEDHDFLYDTARSVAVGPDEAIFAVGSVIKTAQLNNIWAGRYTGDGAPLWTHTYNNPEIDLYDHGFAAGFGPGLVVAAGHESVLGQGSNVWVRAFKAD